MAAKHRTTPTSRTPRQAESTFGEAVGQRLTTLGFFDPTKPSFGEAELAVPQCGIVEASTEVLGTLYANYGVLVNYVSGVVGDLEIERIHREHAYYEVRARALAAIRSGEASHALSVSEKKAMADDQPDVLVARRHMAEAEAVFKKGQRLLEGYKTLWQSLSREISRRVGASAPHTSGASGGNFGGRPSVIRQQEGVRRRAGTPRGSR